MLIEDSVGIFVNSDTSLYHFQNLKFSEKNFFTNIHEYENSLCEYKFAAFHIPFPHQTIWLEDFEAVHKISNHVFIFCSELHQNTVEQIKETDKRNVSIFICGKLNFSLKNAKVYEWMDWFTTSVYFYKHVNPNLINSKLIASSNKKDFDILLGCSRTHRNYVYDYIINNNLQEKVILSYYKFCNIDLRTSDFIEETDGVEYLNVPNHTIHHVKYYGYRMNLSQIIPFNVYNSTQYTLVTETNAVNEFNFYTEKIVKPILAKRLFIVIAGKHYLKNLRLFGFKTFDGIIDESYDNEEDDFLRWEMALNQLKKLTEIDHYVLKEQINKITNHNFNIMMSTEWYEKFNLQLKSVVDLCPISDHTIDD